MRAGAHRSSPRMRRGLVQGLSVQAYSRRGNSARRAAGSAAEAMQAGGAGTRNRTRDLLITNQLLYQLSYAGASGGF